MLDETLMDREPGSLPMLITVRVLLDVMLRELMAWTVIAFVTLCAPLFVGPDTFPTLCLVVLLIGLGALVLSYAVLAFQTDPLQRSVALIAVLVSLSFIIVNTAILLHPVATTAFALMVWLGALVVLLRLVHTPSELSPPAQLGALMMGVALVITFLCTAQELSLNHLLANCMALALGIMVSAIRWDWLAHHALVTENGVYTIKEVPKAWMDMYTWTVCTRCLHRLCPVE